MHTFSKTSFRLSLIALLSCGYLGGWQLQIAATESQDPTIIPSPVSGELTYPGSDTYGSNNSVLEAKSLLPSGQSYWFTEEIDSTQPVQIFAGEGGQYTYQIWQNSPELSNASAYYLFIWKQDAPEDQAPTISYNFGSATEAISFFSCRYARDQTATCSTLIARVSYDVPMTCVFPWVECE